ncbi:MAG: hypothetical protein V8T86_12220 [Victivallis sp.]
MNAAQLILPALCAAALSLGAAMPRITVDAAKPVGPVNPLAFGANIEAADDRGIFDRPFSAPINPHGVAQGEGTWDPAANRPHPGIVRKLREMRIGMLRYPGGCLAHNYNWKQAVGPLSERKDWKFGIDEYIRLCRELDAEPIITMTDYALPAEELPKHMAELVEYLNAPAVPEHPWAMKRAAWGNPEPYRVRYFELGNESNHGSHNLVPRRHYTPEEYAAYFRSCAAAMRKIDPAVQLGIVMEPGTGELHDSPWNRTVLEKAGRAADFIVVHFYAPRIADQTPQEALAAVLAYGDQVELRLKNYRDLARTLTGRELPLAMTEFNIGSTGNKPYPWRFSYLAGLMNADLQRIWLRPENGMLCANYWQVINGYWGSFVSNDKGEITLRRAPVSFIETWGKYTGSELVETGLENIPRREAAAVPGLAISRGERIQSPEAAGEAKPGAVSGKGFPEGISITANGAGEIKIRFDNFDGRNAYPEFAELPRPEHIPQGDAFSYLISFDAKYTPDRPGERPSGAVGLGMVDSRGWEKTASAVSVPGIQAATEWKHFTGKYQVLPDTPGSKVLLRVEGVSAPLAGTAEIRNLKFAVETQPVFPAYRTLTALASRSADGETLYLVVFNKDPENALKAELKLKNFDAFSGSGVVLTGESPETAADTRPRPVTVTPVSGSFVHEFPAASMTALEFRR